DLKRALGNVAYSTINEMIAAGQLPEPIRPRRGLALFPERPLLDALRRMGRRLTHPEIRQPPAVAPTMPIGATPLGLRHGADRALDAGGVGPPAGVRPV